MGGEIIFAHGESNARGVAVLKNKRTQAELKHVWNDETGRILIVKIETESSSLNICNIYAHNDNPSFFTSIGRKLADLESDEIMVAGDLNLYIDRIDCNRNQNHKNKYAIEVIKNLVYTFDLVDCWRTQHTDDREYTWRRKNTIDYDTTENYYAARLDVIFIAKQLLGKVRHSEHLTGFLTDHSFVRILYASSKEENLRGPGFWRLNTTILHDNKYCNNVRNIIKEIKARSIERYIEKWGLS